MINMNVDPSPNGVGPQTSKQYFDFVPAGCNRYLFEFNHKKSSKKGCVFGKEGLEMS